MWKPRNIHLFNCDRTYKLDAVEDWWNGTKLKLGFEFSVEKHYFSLSEMSEWSSEKIPGLQMDLAVFVVHAHESRLSINEDNAGIGYAKIYKALLRATGDNVIIVVGGDDNYKDEDEEDREFISRWAKRKVSSQFSEEFLDGTKSFIFSWNKKHREIHEEALVHFVKEKGQKFEYQPKRKLPQRPTTSPPARAAGPVQPSKLNRSLSERPSSGERDRSADTIVASGNRSLSDQGAIPKQRSSSVTETTKQPQALAIFGCSVAEDSMQSVKHVFQKVSSKRKDSALPQVENLSPAQVKRYLEKNVFNICLLVVDAETLKDAYDNLPQRKDEYEELLKTAMDRVAERVIILVCDSTALPPNDEEIVHRTIERVLGEKGFIAWLKNGMLTMDPDVLVQLLDQTSTTAQIKQQRIRPEGFQGPTNVSSVSCTESRQCDADQSRGNQTVQLSARKTRHELEKQSMQQPQRVPSIQQSHPPATTTKRSSTGAPVLVKSKLRYGKISRQPGDVEIWRPGFDVPEHIAQNLMENYWNISEAAVKIVSDPKDKSLLRWSVYQKPKGEGIEIAGNEVVMLQARVRYGDVSLEKGDLFFLYPGWEIPQYIMESIKRDHGKARCGELYIISDERGNLRYKVDITLIDRAAGFMMKPFKRR